MELASQIATVAGVGLTVPQSAGPVQRLFHKLNTRSRVQKWSARVDQILTTVNQHNDYIPDHTRSMFLDYVDEYLEAKRRYRKMVEQGELSPWFGDGKEIGEKVIERARVTWEHGVTFSTQARIAKERCELAHKNVPKSAGKCPICFPEGLDQMPESRRQLPDTYYTDDWHSISERRKTRKIGYYRRLKIMLSLESGETSTPSRVGPSIAGSEQQPNDSDLPPYDYDLAHGGTSESPREADVTDASLDGLQDREIVMLYSAFRSDTQGTGFEVCPLPEEENHWSTP